MRQPALLLTMLALTFGAAAQTPQTYKGWEMKVSRAGTASTVGQGTMRRQTAGRDERIVVFRFEAKRLADAGSIFVKDFRLIDDSGKQYGTDIVEYLFFRGKKHDSIELPFVVSKGTRPKTIQLNACPNCVSVGGKKPPEGAEIQEITFQLENTPAGKPVT